MDAHEVILELLEIAALYFSRAFTMLALVLTVLAAILPAMSMLAPVYTTCCSMHCIAIAFNLVAQEYGYHREAKILGLVNFLAIVALGVIVA